MEDTLERFYIQKKIQHPEDIFTIGIYLNQELAAIS